MVNLPFVLEKVYNCIKMSPTGIELKNKTLSASEYASWWNELNCLVFVSSGESYSIQPRQALMQGIPVILSKNTAHLDLLDIPGILWVNADTPEPAYFSGQPDANLTVGHQFGCEISDIIDKMAEVKKNYKYWKEQAKIGGEIIKKRVKPSIIKNQWEALI